MVQPTQPKQPKPGPKLTKLLETFFKALRNRTKVYENPKSTPFAKRSADKETKRMAVKLHNFQGDPNLSRLYGKLLALSDAYKSGDHTHKTMLACQAALEDWWGFIKSPWEDIGEYDDIVPIPWNPGVNDTKLPDLSKPNMATEQQTPVDTGTKSTEADAVHVAGKAVARKGSGRGADLVVKINTRLTTRLIEAGHQAFLALEKPGHDVDLAAVKARWICSVQELITARFKAGSGYPVIDGINFQKFYGATSAKTKDEIKIEKLEAKLAKLKAKVRNK